MMKFKWKLKLKFWLLVNHLQEKLDDVVIYIQLIYEESGENHCSQVEKWVWKVSN